MIMLVGCRINALTERVNALKN